MKERKARAENLSGSLLLAHPGLRDPNFQRTVILISLHSAEGAMGVVVNRPAGKTLGELSDQLGVGPLARLPVYVGGPVQTDQLILAAWETAAQAGEFRLQFGLDPGKASEFLAKPGMMVRAFIGYSGWSAGQIEGELKQNTWIVRPLPQTALDSLDGVPLWRRLMSDTSPVLGLLAGAPDNPEMN